MGGKKTDMFSELRVDFSQFWEKKSQLILYLAILKNNSELWLFLRIATISNSQLGVYNIILRKKVKSASLYQAILT